MRQAHPVVDRLLPDRVRAGDLDIEVELRGGQDSLPLGVPLEYTIAIRNDGAKSVSVPVEVVLAPPSGDDVTFYTTTLFAPAGDEVTEDGRVHAIAVVRGPAGYTVAVNAFGDAAGDAVELDVSDPTVIVPVFEDVTETAGADDVGSRGRRVGGSPTGPPGAMSTQTATPICSSRVSTIRHVCSSMTAPEGSSTRRRSAACRSPTPTALPSRTTTTTAMPISSWCVRFRSAVPERRRRAVRRRLGRCRDR